MAGTGEAKKVRHPKIRVEWCAGVLAIAWTVGVAGLLMWNLREDAQQAMRLVAAESGLVGDDGTGSEGRDGASGAVHPVDVMGGLCHVSRGHLAALFVGNGLLWLVGVGGICAGVRHLRRQVRQRERAEDVLRQSGSRFCALFRTMTEGVAFHELVYDEEGRAVDYVIVDVNAGYERHAGVAREHAIGKKASELYGTGEPPYFELYKAVAESGEPTSFETYFEPMKKHFAISVVCPGPGQFATVFEDITERKRTEQQLVHSALHDNLTGLANRNLFMDRLGRSIERMKRRDDYLFAVLFLDLDRFKVVNDGLGHLAGDQLLVAVAGRLKACMRSADTLARVGGDEFAVLAEDIKDAADATRVAKRLQKGLSAPFSLRCHDVFITSSIGIAPGAKGYDRPEELLRDADVAMYRSKTLGRARYEMFDTSMHAQAVAMLRLETDLWRAVERNEFRLYYQPIISLPDGKIDGFEALLRWQHPKRGVLLPGAFLALAEETGLMVAIGRWVLHEACRQMREWQQKFAAHRSLSISVNLSAKQLAQPDLAEQVERILEQTGLDAGSLILEVPESLIIAPSENASEMLVKLKGLGLALHMDDFGTGHSSLGYLHRFPIDALKVDRSFIAKMGSDHQSWEIVRTIIMLAHNLRMDVIAEGVETGEQLTRLKSLHCEHWQGYLFSKAVPPDAAADLIAAGRVPVSLQSSAPSVVG